MGWFALDSHLAVALRPCVAGELRPCEASSSVTAPYLWERLFTGHPSSLWKPSLWAALTHPTWAFWGGVQRQWPHKDLGDNLVLNEVNGPEREEVLGSASCWK